MIKHILLVLAVSCLIIACDKPAGNATPSAADQKAEALLKEAYALIDQKKAPEAEAKLLEVIALKPQLSEKVRAQVGPSIAGLGFVEPARAVKLGQEWDKP